MGNILRRAMNSLNQLAIYARTPNVASIPPNVRLISNDTTLTIFDLFPKAKFHFLVLPRIPLAIRSTPQPDDILDVPDSALDSITTFLASAYAADILRELSSAADEAVEMVRDEMIKTEGFSWGVNVGLHAIPSMKHLHLHVISDDLISPALKTKKHYQSFDPKHGFFLHLEDIQRIVNSGKRALPLDTASYSAMLRGDMACWKCGQPARDIPSLKAHLEGEWRKERDKAVAAARR